MSDGEAKFQRAIVIVLDSVGAGEMPDAARFGDAGANTLLHVRRATGGLEVPNMLGLGLGRAVAGWDGPDPARLAGAFGRMAERSDGKDTTTGHWEMVGLVTEQGFPVFPEGLPPEALRPIEEAIGRRFLWNRPASGTEIIQRFGDEHVATGRPIAYTSADSVFQVACHEGVVPLEDLYRICRVSREKLQGRFRVARVIARPFAGTAGAYERTVNRKDFSVSPPAGHLLERLRAAGKQVISVGKIRDIFDGHGISRHVTAKTNAAGIRATSEIVRSGEGDLVFVNLVDFDMLYGHRRDPAGYRRCLEEFDRGLAHIQDGLRPRDLLLITADHGNDPTFPGSDHTREHVPLLASARGLEPADLGVRASFADLGRTIADNFGVDIPTGTSFLDQLRADSAA